ncbi:unnamed protein product [Bemisia tabaci]|uniref:Elongation factor Ts, mitochondrial n=1 Tax=Bemisia tabaci TaxID=7038 RepID=A0A9P0ACX8_BEMTA|nr:unnamed protein product [Bemisia tabaci]
MLGTQLARLFHSTNCNLSASKSALAELRKKTGYTFANCKKALETNNNDLAQAEKWLQEQAQALGWAKASKLQGRAASQGLLGVSVDNNHASVVEVNCETDFVAKNGTFKSFVELVTSSCLQLSKQQKNFSNSIAKTILGNEQLKNSPCSDGKSLGDHTALAIGSVGENVILSRALCLSVDGDLKLAGHVHPPSEKTSYPLLGRFAAVVVYKANPHTEITEKVGKQLCQHIIGMNPSAVGNPETDKPAEDADSEKNLIFQQFLINSDVTVQELLQEHNMTVVDFCRLECAEEFENQEKSAAQQAG